jgi:hypothetical protein
MRRLVPTREIGDADPRDGLYLTDIAKPPVVIPDRKQRI